MGAKNPPSGSRRPTGRPVASGELCAVWQIAEARIRSGRMARSWRPEAASRAVVLQWLPRPRCVASGESDAAKIAVDRPLAHRRAPSHRGGMRMAFKRSRVRLPSAPLCHSFGLTHSQVDHGNFREPEGLRAGMARADAARRGTLTDAA